MWQQWCTLLPLWEARGLLANVLGHVLTSPSLGSHTTASDLEPEPDICEELTKPEKEVMQQGMRAEQGDNAHGHVSLPIAVGLAP